MGRHAQFERQEVLEKAAKTFWDLGFHATRMTDLIKSTELQPGSLYATFTSKDQLFLECLDSYGKKLISDFELSLSSKPPKQALIDYFQTLIKELESTNRPHGCLLVNSLMELSKLNHQSAIILIEGYVEQIERLFEKTINDAISFGEMSSEVVPRDMACTLMMTIWGARILSELSNGQEKINGVIRQIIKIIEEK